MTTSKNLQNFYNTKQAGLAEYIKKLLAGGLLGAGAGGAYGAGRGYFGDETNKAVEDAKLNYEKQQEAIAVLQKQLDSEARSRFGVQNAQYDTDMQNYQRQLKAFEEKAYDTYQAELAAANTALAAGESKRDREIKHRQRYLDRATRREARDMMRAKERILTQDHPKMREQLAEEMAKLDLSNPRDVKKHFEMLDKINRSWEWDADWYRDEEAGLKKQLDEKLQPYRDRLEDTTAEQDALVAELLAARDAVTPEQSSLVAPPKPVFESAAQIPGAELPDYQQMKLDAARNKGIQSMGLGALIGGGAGLGYQALNDLLFSGGPEPKYASESLGQPAGSLMNLLGVPAEPHTLKDSLGDVSSDYLSGKLTS